MMLFLPELTLLGAGLVIFFVSIRNAGSNTVKNIAITLGALIFGATLLGATQEGDLFYNSYRVDLFSQTFKILMGGALLVVLLFGSRLDSLRKEIHP